MAEDKEYCTCDYPVRINNVNGDVVCMNCLKPITSYKDIGFIKFDKDRHAINPVADNLISSKS